MSYCIMNCKARSQYSVHLFLCLNPNPGSLPACRLIVEIAGPRCIMDQDSQGRSALHLATMGGHGDVVNFLLEKHGERCHFVI